MADGIATVDLNERFAAGRDPAACSPGSRELVRTLTGSQGDDRRCSCCSTASAATGMFPGVSTSRPITLPLPGNPQRARARAAAREAPPPDPAVKATQQRLIALGYLLRGDDDGRFGPATQNAILAFQKWERLDRTGLIDAETKTRLATATRPAGHPAEAPGSAPRSCSTARSRC